MSLKKSTLLKILRSSKRIQDIRDLVGLKDGEYVRGFSQEGLEIENRKSKKIRIIKKIQGESACIFTYNKILPRIEKEVIKHFDLPVNPLDVILMERIPQPGYGFLYAPTGENKMIITINFFRRLNAEEYNLLFDKIKEYNSFLTKGPDFEKIKPIIKFDEKFLLTKEYDTLKKQYPKGIPEDIRQKLVQRAKAVLKIKTPFTDDDFRKIMSEFNKNLKG